MVQAVLTIVASAEKRDEVLKSMRSTIGPSRTQPGCTGCHVLIDAVEPRTLTLVHTWQTRADLERHVTSETYRTLLAIMETSVDPPEVLFQTVSKTEGFELVESLRG